MDKDEFRQALKEERRGKALREALTLIVVIISTTWCCFVSNVEAEVITVPDYEAEIKHNRATKKLMIDVVVELVDGRLPNKSQLQYISYEILSEENNHRHDNIWITYALPEYKAWAFATDHNTQISGKEGVQLHYWAIKNTVYEKLIPKNY